MRYKFFNTVIHQGLRGWGKGGRDTGEREGLRNVLAPFWFILKDSVAISAIVTQSKKCLKIIKKKKKNCKHPTRKGGNGGSSSHKVTSQRFIPNQLTIRKVSMVFWDGDHDVCEAGCLIPPWAVKSGVKAALLQHHIRSAISGKKKPS